MRTSYPPFTSRSTLAFHRQAGAERVLELLVGRGAARKLPRERQPAVGRHHHRLDAVADRHLEHAVGVLQLGDVDLRLALAADVDERHLRADRDDRAFDGLPSLEAPRLKRRLEHGREIFFFGFGHNALLQSPVKYPSCRFPGPSGNRADARPAGPACPIFVSAVPSDETRAEHVIPPPVSAKSQKASTIRGNRVPRARP